MTECWLDMLCVMAAHSWGNSVDADLLAARKILEHGRESAARALPEDALGSFTPFARHPASR